MKLVVGFDVRMKGDVTVDNLTCGREKDFRLGVVARAISDEQDLFAVVADPLNFTRAMRFPSGPAILLPDNPLPANYREQDLDPERWDGLA